jgi:hypothetical protein
MQVTARLRFSTLWMITVHGLTDNHVFELAPVGLLEGGSIPFVRLKQFCSGHVEGPLGVAVPSGVAI